MLSNQYISQEHVLLDQKLRFNPIGFLEADRHLGLLVEHESELPVLQQYASVLQALLPALLGDLVHQEAVVSHVYKGHAFYRFVV